MEFTNPHRHEMDSEEFDDFIEKIRNSKSLKLIIQDINDFNLNVVLDEYHLAIFDLYSLKKELNKKFKNDPQLSEFKEIINICLDNAEFHNEEDWERFKYQYIEILNDKYEFEDFNGKIIAVLGWLVDIDKRGILNFQFDDKYHKKKFRKFLKRQLDYLRGLKEFNITSMPNRLEVNTNRLVNKEQILLLNELGFFDLEKIKSLNTEQKGKLVGYLLNRDSKNNTDYIRYCNPGDRKNVESNPYRHSKYVNKIIKFLNDLEDKQ